MKLVSWNVAGLRACLKKGFSDFFTRINADIVCLEETKVTMEELEFKPEGYEIYLNPAEKKGYSGVAVYTRIHPLNVSYGMGIDCHDHEGRIITLEFAEFFLIAMYVPNSKRELVRLDYRMEWEKDFREYLQKLEKQKPVIFCGDLNVAHQEIDLKNPKTNRRNAGFTDEERGKMTALLNAGFTDTFRYLYPDKTECYSWWSYLFHAREKNAGWRIDYFIVSKSIEQKIKESYIFSEVMGSDHCPVGLEIDFSTESE